MSDAKPLPTTPRAIVEAYLADNLRIVTWPQIGDDKGPQGASAKGWPLRTYTIDDYTDTSRVGLVTGHPIAPERVLHDVDIDWAPGTLIAQAFLPPTAFVFGRASKRVSHCVYTTPDGIPTFQYQDIDGTVLIEIRGVKRDGGIGFQTMAPPSIWMKGTAREPLTFVSYGIPSHIDTSSGLKQRVCLAAIAMLLAKHFGTHGFGHESRLAWAGYLLRAGVPINDLVTMGEAISHYCDNREIGDVRRVLESTQSALASSAAGKRIKGGPALAKLFGEKGRKIVARINEWLGHDSDFVRANDGAIIKDHQDNIRRAFTLIDKQLTYNLFSGKMLDGGQPLEDRLIEETWLRIDREFKFRPTRMFFDAVMRDTAYEHRFHPVRDYLDALVWDGVPRVDTWLVVCAGSTDSAYTRAVSAIVLIAAVRRIRQPGCKYDELLVLESRQQGLNKSTALRTLCPNEEWFSDDLPLNVDGQRVIEATQGKWIIEASELVGRRSDREHLKSMLSRQVDHARLAYDHHSTSKRREFISIGTTNSDDYLSDPSGGRRFWPMPIIAFNIPVLREMRDQLWAEASHREAAGESIRLHESLWPAAGEQQKKRHESHAFEDVVRNALIALPVFQGRRRVTSDAIWTAMGIELKDRPRLYKQIAELMTRFGFKRTTIRVEGHTNPQSGYISIEVGDPQLMVTHEDEPERQIGDEDGDTMPSDPHGRTSY